MLPFGGLAASIVPDEGQLLLEYVFEMSHMRTSEEASHLKFVE